jgi:hypothetical protein
MLRDYGATQRLNIFVSEVEMRGRVALDGKIWVKDLGARRRVAWCETVVHQKTQDRDFNLPPPQKNGLSTDVDKRVSNLPLHIYVERSKSDRRRR